MNPCVVVPVYNHAGRITEVVEDLEAHELPTYLIDDGSDRETADCLDELSERFDWVTVEHRAENGGKGAALTDGFYRAHEDGYTHAVALDADAQHDVGDLPEFLRAAEDNPGALIIADPVFDESAPSGRLYGRKISTFWVCLETLSRDIHDPLVGYRCYPVERTLSVIEKYQPGLRMEFDPEVLVRFYWEYGEVVNVPTSVTYDTGETSHFNLVADNLRISYTHMKLFFGMIPRMPGLLRDSFQ